MVSLFDLEADPKETRNLVGEHAELARSVGSVAEAETRVVPRATRNRRKSEAAAEAEDDDENRSPRRSYQLLTGGTASVAPGFLVNALKLRSH